VITKALSERPKTVNTGYVRARRVVVITPTRALNKTIFIITPDKEKLYLFLKYLFKSRKDEMMKINTAIRWAIDSTAFENHSDSGNKNWATDLIVYIDPNTTTASNVAVHIITKNVQNPFK
jgi:hypothetical protein